VKTPDGYRVEPVVRTPGFSVNGRAVGQPVSLLPGDMVEIEGYQIQVDFEALAVPPVTGPTPIPLEVDTDSAKTVFLVKKPLGQLVVLAGPLKGLVRPLVPGEIRIGRDQSQNEIVIRNDSKGEIDKSISRRHASIHVDGSTVSLEDQKSVAGTFVNGRPAPPKQRMILKSGDQIEIRSAKESTVIRVELDAPGSLGQSPPPLSGPAPLPPLPEVLPPLSASPLPPPLAATPSPPPLAPLPQRDSRPAWAPPPEPVREQPPERPERSPRARARATFDDNPFQQVEDVSWYHTLPSWTWFAAGAALIILVVSFLLICR
ncbi:MAG TPA: FHA domain-containing protein, partial [Gammaproteobacteria bacterium]|nr:FHA domain-containing protein [Gammaproteobacteria bacterium]